MHVDNGSVEKILPAQPVAFEQKTAGLAELDLARHAAGNSAADGAQRKGPHSSHRTPTLLARKLQQARGWAGLLPAAQNGA